MHAQTITLDNTKAIAQAIQMVAKLSHESIAPEQMIRIPLMRKIAEQMNESVTLKFLLPAFPAKSPSKKKTAGVLPDMGEVIALRALNEMCRSIAQIYAPGAEVVICSDGRIFSDVVGVDDETIDAYQEGIDTIIQEFNLYHISTFSLDNLYPELKGDVLRDRLMWQFAKSKEEVRFLVMNDPHYAGLFNGIHKFMIEDQSGVMENATRNQLNKATKPKTYELMRRSDAWSALLNHYFPEALRFSIHPYPLEHEKFGVKLVNSSSKWATPWHNVAVKMDGKFELMHLCEAQKLGAQARTLGGKYVFFEV